MGTTAGTLALIIVLWITNAVHNLTETVTIPGHAVPAVAIDTDGRVMVPTDFNGDGLITGDIEWGS